MLALALTFAVGWPPTSLIKIAEALTEPAVAIAASNWRVLSALPETEADVAPTPLADFSFIGSSAVALADAEALPVAF